VILSGPSGVGKDTVIEAWRKRNPRVRRVVSYTTRNIRPGEVHGVDYHFVSRDQFESMARDGDFLEYKEVHGNFYATPLRDMEHMLAEGAVAILKIDVQGALAAMGLRADALAIFLLPPSQEELERRIRDRGTEPPHIIELRLQNARSEMALSRQYHHAIVNDCLDGVVDELERLVR
jgi:guanylate kinase